MAYNVEKLAKLGALKELGLKQKAVDEAQNKRGCRRTGQRLGGR